MTQMRSGARGERGDVVLGWLTKVTVALALVGVIGFDAVALGIGRLNAEDRAQEAARAAALAWTHTSDVQQAYEAALAQVSRPEDAVPPAGFSVAPDGAVTLTLEHTASTFLVERVGPLEKWTVSRATVTTRGVR